MAYIDQIQPGHATGKLKEIYDASTSRAGYVAGIIKVLSRDAPTLRGMIQFYMALMKSPNALDPAQREMLATVVSNINDCYY